MNYSHLFLYGFLGLAALSFFSTVGAFASRFFRFRYIYIALFCIPVYILVSFFICKEYNLGKSLLVNAVIGFYEATIGSKLCELCKPFYSEEDLAVKENVQLPKNVSLPFTLVFAIFFTFVGYWVSLL